MRSVSNGIENDMIDKDEKNYTEWRARGRFGLGHEYLSGENLPRDYEKAYSCFIKGKDVDWVPIDPEENADFEREGEVEVTSEGLLPESYDDIGWWLFVLGKHSSRALK